MKNIEKTHFKRVDQRIDIVRSIIGSLQVQLNEIHVLLEEYGLEYWDTIYADDTEHLVGIVFICLQNYINSSISDLYPELTSIYLKYSIEPRIENTDYTKVQLIISIANYYKHRDLPTTLRENTLAIFNDLKINYKIDSSREGNFYMSGSDSPIFTGLSILSENWDFNELVDIVSLWRENMWQIEGYLPV
ncbi:hypothetical protein ACR780_07370 [Sphingobacterium faecium]|uniref:hypothetical protein n=1 Tax=Sphingobacterium faecium TaxID=34087 RepID=UPI003DA3A1B8